MAFAQPRKTIESLVVILFSFGLGYLAISDLYQEIRYHCDGKSATARSVTYHSSFRSARRYDVVHEREGEQVHAKMYARIFASPEAGDEILYLPDGPDAVILNSSWSRFVAFAGDPFVAVLARFAGLGGLSSLLSGDGRVEKDDTNARMGTEKEPVNP
jgi:hypothetical protein